MWDMNEVTRVEYRGEYVYQILFDDGVGGEIDFSDYLSQGPVFETLKDGAVFSQATVEGGTISWPNGADIAPETLYEKILHAKSLQRTRKKTVRS
jgi:hypothetical protein